GIRGVRALFTDVDEECKSLIGHLINYVKVVIPVNSDTQKDTSINEEKKRLHQNNDNNEDMASEGSELSSVERSPEAWAQLVQNPQLIQTLGHWVTVDITSCTRYYLIGRKSDL
ncbi:MAG: hypothetical protein EZS28_031309, partial [Streblomastix strix]